MQETRRNLMVGMFVLIGLLSLGTLVVLFGKGPTWLMKSDTYPLHIRFEQVAGVRAGNVVTVRGLDIGRVVDIQLLDPTNFDAGVDAVVAINNRYKIPLGSRAQTTEPVLGQGRPPVEIIAGPSTGEFLEPGATLTGTVRTAIDSIFPPGVVTTFQNAARQIGDAAEAMTPALNEMQELLRARDPRLVDQPGGLPGNLSSAVARFDSALRHFNEVLGDEQVKSQLRDTIANLHTMSESGTRAMTDVESASGQVREMVTDGRKLIGTAEKTLGSMDTNINELARRTMGTLDRMDTVLDNLSKVSAQIAAGDGTLGQFVMNNDLYESLVISTERLGLAITDFRALIAEWREGKVRVGL